MAHKEGLSKEDAKRCHFIIKKRPYEGEAFKDNDALYIVDLGKPANTETPPKAKTNHEEPVSVCRNRLLVSILAVAIDRHKYELNNTSKNTANKAIDSLKESLDKHCISISSDEISRYLTEAKVIHARLGDKKLPVEKPKTEAERKNLLLIFISMAIDTLDHIPDKGRNNASGTGKYSIKNIVKKILGIPIDDGTIKKYLDEGKKLLQLSAPVDSDSKIINDRL